MPAYYLNNPINPLDVSSSALAAQRTRMNVIANNLANVNTTRNDKGEPAVYRRKEVIFKVGNPLETGSHRYGVRVKGVRPDKAELRMEYRPNHPDADRNGYVKMPNVRPPLEMIDMIEASRAYEANITSIQVTRAMNKKSLELLT